MSDTPATVIRTRVYRGRWTPVLDEALTRCRHQQRAMYNRTINAVSPQGGAVPATMKSPGHPNGLYGQLTEWRGRSVVDCGHRGRTRTSCGGARPRSAESA